MKSVVQQRSVRFSRTVSQAVGVGQMQAALDRMEQSMVDAVGCCREKGGRILNTMLNEVSACNPSAQFTAVRLGVERFEKGFLSRHHRTFNLEQFCFEEHGINAAGIQRHSVGGCFECITLVTLFLSKKSSLKRPCFAGLAVEGEAAFVGFQGQLVFAFSLQQLSVVKPIA